MTIGLFLFEILWIWLNFRYDQELTYKILSTCKILDTKNLPIFSKDLSEKLVKYIFKEYCSLAKEKNAGFGDYIYIRSDIYLYG